LVGCDHPDQVVLPQCLDGQGLSTNADGDFQCQAVLAPSFTVSPRTAGCKPGDALQYGDTPAQIECLDLTKVLGSQAEEDVLRQRIDDLTQKITSLNQSVAQLRTMAQPSESLYVGSTTAMTTGRITAAGSTGLLAASALCAAQFGARAHMCTQFQLTRTVALGKLGPKDRIAPAWIYMPTWHNPNASTSEPLSGLADNCGGYTVGDDASGWAGMAVEWGPLASADVVFRWHGGTEAACSARLPIACCAGGLR
jgi:hypothetical protein